MTVAITGASSGLGWLLASALISQGKEVFNLSLEEPALPLEGVKWLCTDVRNEDSVRHAAATIWGSGPAEIVVNCAGLNRIGFLEDFEADTWDAVLDTNAKGIFHVAKAFLPQLKESKGTLVNLVSNASHMPMTGSLAYNASKGAAHIMTLQLARELTRLHAITVFGVSPNKLAGTGMSLDIDEQVCATRGWTMEYAKEYQRSALLAGEETDPAALAEFLAFLLSTKKRHQYLTGCIIPYGA